MIGIIDYGVGNLFSLRSSLNQLGIESVITSQQEVLQKCSHIILPGVGAFGDAAQKLRQTGLDSFVCEQAALGKPLLGICLGMQLLFERSFEYGEHTGLGLIKGEVVGMQGKLPENLRIPHIGWNALTVRKECPILKYTKEGDFVYFVHSFYVDGSNESAAATAEYGIQVCATVAKDNVFGCQFHPEKSGDVGLAILKAFSEVGI